MTLKLPTPLPYDYVDELIDSELDFLITQVSGYDDYGDVITKHTAIRRNGEARGNCSRMMFSLLDDNRQLKYTPEDADGYCTWTSLRNGETFCWEAEPPTEEELECLLDWMF